MLLTRSMKCLSMIAIAGMLIAVSVGVHAQSADTVGQAEVFLPMVASNGQESHDAVPNDNTPHLNAEENSAEQMVHAAQVMNEAGDVTSTSFELQTDISLDGLDLNEDWSLSSEHPYTRRLLVYIGEKHDYMPEAMTFSVSNADSDTPTMFAAATLGKADSQETHQAGLLIQSELNRDTRQYTKVNERVLPECEELSGVQSNSDGSLVAVLCKTYNTDGAAADDRITKDLVTSHPNDHGGAAHLAIANHSDYDMWLYEWIDSDIDQDPTNIFIVHTSLDDKEHGLPHSFVYGEEDNTYAISISQRVAGGHTNDSMYVVQRADAPENYKVLKMHKGLNVNRLRGWRNSCSLGHPFLVNLGFNPATKQYSVLCTSEANSVLPQGSDIAGISFTRGLVWKSDSDKANENKRPTFLMLQREGPNRMKGGGGALLPLGDGWIGVVIGADVERPALDGNSASPATQIGLVQFAKRFIRTSQPTEFPGIANVIAQPDSNPGTETVGESLYWVETPAEYANHYISYPQLVPLDEENGTYLLGYGIMPARGDSGKSFWESGWELNLPIKYFVQEIQIVCADPACTNAASITPLTEPKELNGAGWGMIDEMISLGNGQVGWATYEMDKMTLDLGADVGSQANAFTNKLQFNVYDSEATTAAPPADQTADPTDATIQIRARGREGQELMELRVDDQIVDQWIVTQEFELYDYTHPTPVSADQISIYFTNDAPNRPGFDTTLHVDKMILNGTTYETEAPSVIGRGYADGSSCGQVAAHLTQALHCDGYFMYDSVAPTGAIIQIRARGREGQELMELRIDDQIVDQWIVTQDFTLYDYAHSTQVNADQISIHFTNDAPNQPEFDPTLHVDRMILGETIYQTEAPSVVGKGHWNGSSCTQEAAHRRQSLQCNGYFLYDAVVPTSTVIAIRAKGREGQELMELRIDGQIVKQWIMTQKFKLYYYSHPTLLSADQVSIHFTNDAPNQPGFDPTLHVDRMVLNGARYQTESATVMGKGYWDGSSCSELAAHRTETLHCNGYFLYE